MKSFFAGSRRFLALFCFAFALFAFVGFARADDIPTFSDPNVTAWVKDYSAFADEYVAAMKEYTAAMKAHDTAKMELIGRGKAQEFQTKSQDLQTRAAAFKDRVKPEEAKKFRDYTQMCAKRIGDAIPK